MARGQRAQRPKKARPCVSASKLKLGRQVSNVVEDARLALSAIAADRVGRTMGSRALQASLSSLEIAL